MKHIGKISVIVPTFARNEKLLNCLYSLFRQTRLPDEIVVVDNSPDKNAKKIIELCRKATPIQVSYYSQLKKGSPHVRNLGIKKANYKILAFIDDDCIADKKWLEEAIRYHLKFPSAIILGKNLNGHPDNTCSCVEHVLAQTAFQRQEYKVGGVSYNHWLDTKNCLMKKSILLEHNIRFDKLFAPFSIYEDVDVARQLEKHGVKIVWNKNMLVSHYGRRDIFGYGYREFQKGRGYSCLETKWSGIYKDSYWIKRMTSYNDVWKKIYTKQRTKTMYIRKLITKKILQNKSPIFIIFFHMLIVLHSFAFKTGYFLEKLKTKFRE